ncbi:hypothetical protein [Dermatobacter hominis]|uniref:hypothetical protein n=1 Tax=Dermatobacter hominis TaxID=2884263 RepID=UPI001D115F06|nr:hypothetical protein [Dermatobacter hominis]UDY37097.1 hypothetical protein LH044_06055 [Dermatobacter hominis]
MHNPQSPTPGLGRRTSALLLAVLATFAFVAAACGGDDDEASPSKSSDERETTTTEKDDGGDSGIASGILDSAAKSGQFDDSGLGEDVELCLGQSIIDAVGEDQAQQMAEGDISTYTAEEVDALATAFDDCVPGSALAESMTTSFYESAGATTAPSSTVVDCVAGELDGRTGQVVKEGVAVDSGQVPELTLQIMDTCVPPEDVTALLQSAFVDAGLTEAQATCTANALSGQITVSELAQAGLDDGSSEITAKVEAAAQSCR